MTFWNKRVNISYKGPKQSIMFPSPWKIWLLPGVLPPPTPFQTSQPCKHSFDLPARKKNVRQWQVRQGSQQHIGETDLAFSCKENACLWCSQSQPHETPQIVILDKKTREQCCDVNNSQMLERCCQIMAGGGGRKSAESISSDLKDTKNYWIANIPKTIATHMQHSRLLNITFIAQLL